MVGFGTIGCQKHFFQGGTNSGFSQGGPTVAKVHFFQLETRRTPLFYKKCFRKTSIFKIKGGQAPLATPLPTPTVGTCLLRH